MSALVRRGLQIGKQGKRWTEIVGYSVETLMSHLERQFLPGMSWSNIGRWHVDHIVPLAAFHFDSFDDTEFRACWALTNLRPLWAEDNFRKNAARLFLV